MIDDGWMAYNIIYDQLTQTQSHSLLLALIFGLVFIHCQVSTTTENIHTHPSFHSIL